MTTPTTPQMIYALERAAHDLEMLSNRLAAKGDYSAEIPAEDASMIREAVLRLKKSESRTWFIFLFGYIMGVLFMLAADQPIFRG